MLKVFAIEQQLHLWTYLHLHAQCQKKLHFHFHVNLLYHYIIATSHTYLIPLYHLTETVYCGVGKGEQSFPDLCTLFLG